MSLRAGRYYVRRISGFLPPFGVTKRLKGNRGTTYLFGIPFGDFAIVGSRFIYARWPIVDEIDEGGGAPHIMRGRGTIRGLTFCRFRLEEDTTDETS